MPDKRRWEKRQKVLADFGELALRSDDLDAVLAETCRLVAEALGTGHAKVLEIEEEGRTLLVRAGFGWYDGIVARLRLSMAERSSETFSIEAGEPVITNDIASETRFEFPAFIKEAGVKAIANVPIFLPGGRPFGLLQVDASEPRAFDDDDTQFLRTYAMILGPVIDRLLKVQILSKSDERYRSLFESMDEGYLLSEVIVDENGKAIDIAFLEANPAAVRLAGREFIGRTMREIDPHYEDYWYEAYGRVALTGEPLRAEHYAEPHGRWFDFQLSKVGPPESRRVASIYQDVTERRRAEQALRESEEKYRTLFDSIDEGFCVIEVLFDHSGEPTDYVFLEVNAAFERQTGLIAATGRRMRELAPDHERHWFEIYGQIATSGEPQRFELPAEALGRWYDVYAFRIGEPEQRRVAILFNDVAKRKQAERELRQSEERQAFLLALSDALRPLADAGEIQATTTRLLGAHLGADRAMYAEVTGEPGSEAGVIRGQFVRPAAPGRPAPAPFPDTFTYETFGAEVMARRYTGEGLNVADVNADPGFDATERAAWAAVGVQAAIVAPLVKDGRLVAELGVHSEMPRVWTDAEVSLVHEVGERTWAAAERARAEAALRTSEQRYHRLFRSMDEAYAVVEVLKDEGGAWTDFRFVEVNPAFMHHTGMPYPVGRTATELLGTPNPRWPQMYGYALDSGEPLRVQESELALGRTFDLNIFSLDPALNRVAVLFTDITERTRAEAASRESEELQRLTVALVPALLWSANPDGHEITLNEGWLAYTGQSELKAQSYGWVDAIHPEDRDATRAAFEQAFALGEPLEREQRIRKAGDGWRWHLVRHVPVRDESGTITRWFGAAVDIHDSKLAEQAVRAAELRLQTLVEGVPQLVWRAVDGGHWTWASPQWTAYTGQEEADSHDLGWLEPVHPDDRERVIAAWEEAIERGEFHAAYRVCHVGEGRYRWFQTRATPVRDDAGAIIEWLGTSTDVDDMRAMQERQAVMVAELQHRTRNLIAVVRSIAQQTMAQTGPTEAFRDEFNHRLEALARVQGLLSRADEEPITIEALIRLELDALGAKPEPGRIEVDGPAVRIRNTVVQTLTLALHELATNARKYGALSSDSGRLAVHWRTYSDAKGERLALEWEEVGGQPPKADGDARRGYGRELIEQALPYSLNAKTSFEHDEAGLRCTIDMPLERNRSRRKAA